MTPAGSRRSSLSFRVYLVGLSQLIVFALAIFTVDHLAHKMPWEHDRLERSRSLVGSFSSLVDDPDALHRSVALVHSQLGTMLTLYKADGSLLSSSPQTPLPPLSAEQLDTLKREGSLAIRDGDRPEEFAVSMMHGDTFIGYGLVKRRLMPPPPPRPQLLIGLAIALAGVAIVSFLFARSLIQPLSKLAAAARAFGSGNLEARVGLKRNDELGALAHTFDDMAERVNTLLRTQKEFLANISHELRTPLARIRVALDIASESDGEAAKRALVDIAEDWDDLERLVQDVLTATRLDLAGNATANPVLHREPLELATLVDKSVGRFLVLHPDHKIEFSPSAAVTQSMIFGDQTLLRRLFDNLLNNAAKYSDVGTTITVRVVTHDSIADFSIEDHGIGIDAQDLPHLFTPFFRVDRSRVRKTGGVGLGLALAKRIVDAHQGTIAIVSQPGQGTTVKFSLPLGDIA